MSLASLIPIPVSAIKLFDRIDLVSLQNKPPDLVTGPQFAGLADGRLDGPSDHTFQRCDATLQFRDASSQVPSASPMLVIPDSLISSRKPHVISGRKGVATRSPFLACVGHR